MIEHLIAEYPIRVLLRDFLLALLRVLTWARWPSSTATHYLVVSGHTIEIPSYDVDTAPQHLYQFGVRFVVTRLGLASD